MQIQMKGSYIDIDWDTGVVMVSLHCENFTTYFDMEPDKAKELAKGLNNYADMVEEHARHNQGNG